MQLFKLIKASKFFPRYCRQVKCYGHKLAGNDKKPMEFTQEEIKQIKQGVIKMFIDVMNELNNI